MTTFKISRFFDVLITSIILFLLFFCWIRFYTKDPLLSGLLATCLSGFLVFLIFFTSFKHSKKKELSKKEKQTALDCALQLQFSNKKQVLEFFEQVLRNKHQTVKTTCGFLIKERANQVFFVPDFSQESVDLSLFCQIFTKAKELHTKEIWICSQSFEPAVQTFAASIKNFGIKLFDTFSTYEKFIKPSGLLPEKVVDVTPEKLKLKQLLAFAISRQRAKHYFLMGLVLFVCSFLVPFKFYYLLFGSLAFGMALIILLISQKQSKIFKRT